MREKTKTPTLIAISIQSNGIFVTNRFLDDTSGVVSNDDIAETTNELSEGERVQVSKSNYDVGINGCWFDFQTEPMERSVHDSFSLFDLESDLFRGSTTHEVHNEHTLSDRKRQLIDP